MLTLKPVLYCIVYQQLPVQLTLKLVYYCIVYKQQPVQPCNVTTTHNVNIAQTSRILTQTPASAFLTCGITGSKSH